MRIAIVLSREEAAQHHARQAQKPEPLDPDPVQRGIAEYIEAGLSGGGFRIDVDEDIEAIDLYDTPDPPRRTKLGGGVVEGVEPATLRYLYTIIGEPL